MMHFTYSISSAFKGQKNLEVNFVIHEHWLVWLTMSQLFGVKRCRPWQQKLRLRWHVLKCVWGRRVTGGEHQIEVEKMTNAHHDDVTWRTIPLLLHVSIGYINPVHFSPKYFYHDIFWLFTFCTYLMNISESTWKCVTMLAEKSGVSVKIPSALIFELGRQHLRGTILTLISMTPGLLSLSLAQWFLTK